jgi:hypothetical protein
MSAVWVALGVLPWILLGALGVPWLVTGRPLKSLGIPAGWPQGWPLRVFGLVYVLGAIWMTYQTVAYRVAPDTIVFMYVATAVFGGWALFSLRRQRKRSAAR